MSVIAMSTDAAKPVVEQITPAVSTNIRHIALSKLVPSAANVRRVNSTAGVSELADSIEAHGLILHPLVAKVFYDGPSFWRVQSAMEISGQAKDLASSIKEPEACRALV